MRSRPAMLSAFGWRCAHYPTGCMEPFHLLWTLGGRNT